MPDIGFVTVKSPAFVTAALAVVAVVGYFLFKPSPEESLTTTEAGLTGTIGQELVIELNRLKGLQNVGDGLLKDKSFVTLHDYTQTVLAQPLGRSNPLAPIGN